MDNPSVCSREEIDIDFRVSGLSHAIVKEAEHLRVQELVKTLIDKHFKPTCSRISSSTHSAKKSKAMIRELGNVVLFELCETVPKVQCAECLLYWNQGVTYCTCGHLLVESESFQNFSQWRLDAFSIHTTSPRRVRPHGARHGKTDAQKERSVAHNARKRCIKKNNDGIHDRFQPDSVYRDSQLKIGWAEEECNQMDKLAQEDQSYCPSSEEFERYKKHRYITLNKSGKNAPMRLRSDFRTAVT